MSYLSHLVSHIPRRYPHKRAIDDALLDLLAALPDAWTVCIQPAITARWWVVTVERATDAHRWAFFVEPDQQTAPGILSGMCDALNDAAQR